VSFAAAVTSRIAAGRQLESDRWRGRGISVWLLALLAGADPMQNATRRTAHWNYAASDGQVTSKFPGEPSSEESIPRAHAGGRRDRRLRQLADADFDAFFQRHEQSLYGYLRRIVPSHEIAVEVAQEAFFRAWMHFENVRSYERPEAWLYRVATNLAISSFRRRSPVSFAQVFRRADAGEEDAGGGADEALADRLRRAGVPFRADRRAFRGRAPGDHAH